VAEEEVIDGVAEVDEILAEESPLVGGLDAAREVAVEGKMMTSCGGVVGGVDDEVVGEGGNLADIQGGRVHGSWSEEAL
jgi:hypothetical protein